MDIIDSNYRLDMALGDGLIKSNGKHDADWMWMTGCE